MRWRTALVLVGIVGCAQDSASSDGAWTGTVDTLPNGAVHVVSPSEGLWDADEAWTLVEDLRIGAQEGEPYELFSNVISLLVDEEGRIFVLDGGGVGAAAQEVRIFDSDGTWVRTIGSKGEGPGEFAVAAAMAWMDDGSTLLVPDDLNARYNRFDTSGVFLGSAPRNTSYGQEPWGGSVGDDGRYLDVVRAFTAAGDRIAVLTAVDLETGVGADSFPVPATWVEPEYQLPSLAYAPSLRWGALPDRSIWYGTNDTYRFVRGTFDGDTLMIVERQFDPPPLTSEQASAREEALAPYRALPSFSTLFDEDRLLTERIPTFSEVFMDDRGNLWVTPYGAPTELTTAFDVFDPEGRYLGQARSGTPIVTRYVTLGQGYPIPVITGEHMYALVRDEFDVPYVVRMRIVK